MDDAANSLTNCAVDLAAANASNDTWIAQQNRRIALGEAVKLVVSAEEVYGPHQTVDIAKVLEAYLNGEQPA